MHHSISNSLYSQQSNTFSRISISLSFCCNTAVIQFMFSVSLRKSMVVLGLILIFNCEGYTLLSFDSYLGLVFMLFYSLFASTLMFLRAWLQVGIISQACDFMNFNDLSWLFYKMSLLVLMLATTLMFYLLQSASIILSCLALLRVANLCRFGLIPSFLDVSLRKELALLSWLIDLQKFQVGRSSLSSGNLMAQLLQCLRTYSKQPCPLSLCSSFTSLLLVLAASLSANLLTNPSSNCYYFCSQLLRQALSVCKSMVNQQGRGEYNSRLIVINLVRLFMRPFIRIDIAVSIINNKLLGNNSIFPIKFILQKIQWLGYQIEHLPFYLTASYKPQFHNMTLINKLNKLDKKISQLIHELDHAIPTYILYPFAAFFHPGLIWIAYLLIYYFSNFDLRFTALYALSTLVCVILTTLLKKVARRSRPQLDTKVIKFHHFRKKQKNNAMPSGDAFQSAAFVTFLATFGLHPVSLILFHVGVCVGRVYYMCHWVADTLVASIIGTLVAKLILSFEGSQFLQILPQTLLL